MALQEICCRHIKDALKKIKKQQKLLVTTEPPMTFNDKFNDTVKILKERYILPKKSQQIDDKLRLI